MTLNSHLSEHNAVWQSADGMSVLYCADAFSLMTDIPDNSIDCIWTDPRSLSAIK